MEKSTLENGQTAGLEVLEEPEELPLNIVDGTDYDSIDSDDSPSDPYVDLSQTSEPLPRNPDDSPFLASSSPFKAEPEEYAAEVRKSKRGRPPNTTPAHMPTNTATCPLPRPSFRVYKSDATSPNQRSKQFFNWWNAAPLWARDRMIAYVYRDHPVLLWDAEAESKIPFTAKNKKFKYIDKISGSEPIQDDMDLLHKYGCGSYKIMLNEDLKDPSKMSKTLAECYALNVGGGDYKSNPPTDNRISDVEQVDLNHPQNTAYVSFLRGTGKLPEQQSTKEKEAEMAQAEVIKDTLTENRRLTDKVIAMAQDNKKDQTPDAMNKAIDGAMGILHESVKTGNDVTQKAVEFAQRTQEKMMDDIRSRESLGVVDPMDQLNRVLELVGKLKGDGGSSHSSDEVAELRRQVYQMQAERIASLEARLNTAPAANPAATPFGSVKEGLQAMKEMKSVIDDISGGAISNTAKDAVEESAADLAPKWLRPFIPVLVPAIGALAEGFFRSRMPTALQPQPQPQPTYQPPPAAAPQSAPSNIMTMPNPNGGLPAPAPVSMPIMPSNETYGLPPQVAQLLSDIRVPLLNHLNHGMSGARFSDWFIGGFGEPVYRQVTQFGVDGLLTALYTYAPIGQNLSAAYQRENVRAFVDDFIDPDYEAMEKEIAEENRKAEEAEKASQATETETDGGAA